MDGYNIDYEILYRGNYSQNTIEIKFLFNENIIFTFKTLYSRFYEIFAQNYNTNFYYCQLSFYCELEIDDVDNSRILNIVLSNKVDDGIKHTNRICFSIKINETFHIFLDNLKYNHCKVVKNSKW
jgi:hypothetical protein